MLFLSNKQVFDRWYVPSGPWSNSWPTPSVLVLGEALGDVLGFSLDDLLGLLLCDKVLLLGGFLGIHLATLTMAHSGESSTSWSWAVLYLIVPFVIQKSEILKVTLSPSRDVIVITPFFGKWKLPLKKTLGDSLADAMGASLRLLLGDILGKELALELRAFA